MEKVPDDFDVTRGRGCICLWGSSMFRNQIRTNDQILFSLFIFFLFVLVFLIKIKKQKRKIKKIREGKTEDHKNRKRKPDFKRRAWIVALVLASAGRGCLGASNRCRPGP